MKFLWFLCFIYAIPLTSSAFYDYPRDFKLGLVRYARSSRIKCSGVFINPDTLLTTAQCLNYGDMKHVISLYDFGTEKSVDYREKSFKFHENYVPYTYKDNVGLIKIRGRVPDDAIVNLPDGTVDHLKMGPHYTFSVKPFRKGYFYELNEVALSSSAVCTFALKRYLPSTRVCSYKDEAYDKASIYEGSPLVYKRYGKTYITGMYMENNMKVHNGERIVPYETIYSYTDWIRQNAGF